MFSTTIFVPIPDRNYVVGVPHLSFSMGYYNPMHFTLTDQIRTKNNCSDRIRPSVLIWSQKQFKKKVENKDQSSKILCQKIDYDPRNLMVSLVCRKEEIFLMKQLFSRASYPNPMYCSN